MKIFKNVIQIVTNYIIFLHVHQNVTIYELK